MNQASKDIKDMLVAESTLALTYAKDLFIGMEPTKPDNTVTIFDTPSFPPDPDLKMDPNGLYYRSSIHENSWLYFSEPNSRALYNTKANFKINNIERITTGNRIYHLYVVAEAIK